MKADISWMRTILANPEIDSEILMYQTIAEIDRLSIILKFNEDKFKVYGKRLRKLEKQRLRAGRLHRITGKQAAIADILYRDEPRKLKSIIKNYADTRKQYRYCCALVKKNEESQRCLGLYIASVRDEIRQKIQNL